jgi:hypothetical protein
MLLQLGNTVYEFFQSGVLREINLCQIEHMFILRKIHNLHFSITFRKLMESVQVPWPEHVALKDSKCYFLRRNNTVTVKYFRRYKLTVALS